MDASGVDELVVVFCVVWVGSEGGLDEVSEVGAEGGVGEAEVGLVAGGLVADVAFGDVVAKEADEVSVEGDVGGDGVVVVGYAELCGGWDFVPLEDAFLLEDFEVGKRDGFVPSR